MKMTLRAAKNLVTQHSWLPDILFYSCSLDLFSPPNLGGRLADRHQLYHVWWWPRFMKFGQKFGWPFLTKFGGPKHQKLGTISDNFVTWLRIFPERNKTSSVRKRRCKHRKANLIQCTLVHKRQKTGLEFWPTRLILTRFVKCTLPRCPHSVSKKTSHFIFNYDSNKNRWITIFGTVITRAVSLQKMVSFFAPHLFSATVFHWETVKHWKSVSVIGTALSTALRLLCRPEETAIPAAVSLLPLATNHASDVLDMPVDPNEPTYCLCHQVSYGEMIGCDNQDVCSTVTTCL